ncbi:uncharacterized protein [Physcomitrium patens]|uniref:uncharacterized protein n=1 Tax=Physcomitrium patens TaxID=3218 RepID=UPI003CCD096D
MSDGGSLRDAVRGGFPRARAVACKGPLEHLSEGGDSFGGDIFGVFSGRNVGLDGGGSLGETGALRLIAYAVDLEDQVEGGTQCSGEPNHEFERRGKRIRKGFELDAEKGLGLEVSFLNLLGRFEADRDRRFGFARK